MKQARTKGKDFMKVSAICVLSIGLFCLAFVGFNQMIFASATDEPTPLPPAVAVEAYTQDQEQLDVDVYTDAFTAPTFTMIEIISHTARSIPSSAIPMEDAAQMGARYIWDVFGTSIDGLYMEIWFSAHASQGNTTWTGMVYMENPLDGTPNEIDGYIVYESSAFPTYIFSIDSITGKRIDISYMCQPDMDERNSESRNQSGRTISGFDRDVDDVMASRTALLNAGWFDMSISEQIAFAGISDETLEAYLQTAMTLAQAQFNTSSVSDVQLTDLATNGLLDGVVDLAAFIFTAVDNTGREARIFIPVTDTGIGMVNIITSHNDFIPGFNYDVTGGIG